MTEIGINRRLLSDQVYDLVLTSILDGSRAPGSRVVESEIARQLGVSQAPVREAVKRLVHAGLLVSIPRNGSYVTEISPDEMGVSRELRGEIEAIGASIATGLVEQSDLAGLRDIVSQMATAIERDDWAAFRSLDVEFHRTVVGIAGVGILSRLWDTLELTLISQRAIGDPAYPGHRGSLVGWHQDLIDVLARGNPEKAADAFRQHARGDRPVE
ncbi:MAG: GntR family transcriptional regulator [Bifidobacteriaceae bacterium]|jgi:DNA-binding GntR family transcriptional regulator|nr:GntR family transcriptional regulator [Bifidobacteriaceae bacterium]